MKINLIKIRSQHLLIFFLLTAVAQQLNANIGEVRRSYFNKDCMKIYTWLYQVYTIRTTPYIDNVFSCFISACVIFTWVR